MVDIHHYQAPYTIAIMLSEIWMNELSNIGFIKLYLLEQIILMKLLLTHIRYNLSIIRQ